MISLLDTVDSWILDWYVVFRKLEEEQTRSWWWKLLKPEFQHVEVWRCDRGIWIRIDPCFELVQAEAHELPPWDFFHEKYAAKVVRVQRAVKKGRLREPLFVGPWTCVEIAKSFLGVRAPFVRTPWQLYKRLHK